MTPVSPLDLSPAAVNPELKQVSTLVSELEILVSTTYPMTFLLSAEIGEIRKNEKLTIYPLIEKVESKTFKLDGKIWNNKYDVACAEFRKFNKCDPKKGDKVIVRCKVQFSSYSAGVEIWIDLFDPTYYLGEIERKRIAIRDELKARSLFDRNRSLPKPIDYFDIAVIAPAESKGLADFQAVADEMQALGLIRFIYFSATFQGNRRTATIVEAFAKARELHADSGLDAIVVIRGGGDWSGIDELNDRDIAFALVDSPVPVLVGVGHEDDRTILDEIGHEFGTPSKVIAHIRETVEIASRRTETSINALRAIAKTFVVTYEAAVNQHVAARLKPAIDRRIELVEKDFVVQTTRIHHSAVDRLRRREQDVTKVSAIIAAAVIDMAAQARRQAERPIEKICIGARARLRAIPISKPRPPSMLLTAYYGVGGIAAAAIAFVTGLSWMVVVTLVIAGLLAAFGMARYYDGKHRVALAAHEKLAERGKEMERRIAAIEPR